MGCFGKWTITSEVFKSIRRKLQNTHWADAALTINAPALPPVPIFLLPPPFPFHMIIKRSLETPWRVSAAHMTTKLTPLVLLWISSYQSSLNQNLLSLYPLLQALSIACALPHVPCLPRVLFHSSSTLLHILPIFLKPKLSLHPLLRPLSIACGSPHVPCHSLCLIPLILYFISCQSFLIKNSLRFYPLFELSIACSSRHVPCLSLCLIPRILYSTSVPTNLS